MKVVMTDTEVREAVAGVLFDRDAWDAVHAWEQSESFSELYDPLDPRLGIATSFATWRELSKEQRNAVFWSLGAGSDGLTIPTLVSFLDHPDAARILATAIAEEIFNRQTDQMNDQIDELLP
jgi:hypothetical protein